MFYTLKYKNVPNHRDVLNYYFNNITNNKDYFRINIKDFIYNYAADRFMITDISTTTLIKRIIKIAKKIPSLPIFKNKIYEVDEMRTFIGSKEKPIWIVYALERQTKQVVNFSLGRRTKRTLQNVTNTLVLSNPKTIYTDKLIHYKSLLNGVTHSTKPFGTNHIERNNLSLRTHLKRLNRKTICFSRSFIMLQCVLRIFFWS